MSLLESPYIGWVFQPVLVTELTSTGRGSDQYWYILRTSTAPMSDQYWYILRTSTAPMSDQYWFVSSLLSLSSN